MSALTRRVSIPRACFAALMLLVGAGTASATPNSGAGTSLGPRVESTASCTVAPPIVVPGRTGTESVQAAPLVIQPIWDPSFVSRPSWQAVVQQAIAEWQG